jgi:Ca-activated chloride channel homolog
MMMRFSWLIILVALFSINIAQADEYRSKINEGYDLYKDGEYEKAAEKFKDAGILKPDKALPAYDKGTALYKSNDFEGAANEFQGSVAKNDPGVKADAFYNAGNSYFRAGKYDQAIKSYVDALKLQPQDKDSKHNLEISLMQMKQQQQQNKDKQNQDQEKQDQQKQDQNKDKQDQQQAQNQQDKDKQDQKQQQQQQASQQQKEEMDKQKAQELLARFANDEKDIQKRLKQVHVNGKSANDW